MDELKQHIDDLQHNQRVLAASQNNMQKVINCHSENMEKLNNYTLKFNDRVTALEKILKLDKEQRKDGFTQKHSDEFKVVKEDLRDQEKKLYLLQDNTKDVIENTNVEFKKEISLLKKDHNQESMKIKELLKEILRRQKKLKVK